MQYTTFKNHSTHKTILQIVKSKRGTVKLHQRVTQQRGQGQLHERPLGLSSESYTEPSCLLLSCTPAACPALYEYLSPVQNIEEEEDMQIHTLPPPHVQ